MQPSDLVYGLAPSWGMALLCWLVAIANIYQSLSLRYRKRWQKRIKAINWFILASAYMYDHATIPEPGEAKVIFRLAIGLLVLGELAYHFDTLLNIAEVIAQKAKRKVRHGTTDNS